MRHAIPMNPYQRLVVKLLAAILRRVILMSNHPSAAESEGELFSQAGEEWP